MGGINTGKAIVGGLVAGVIIAVGDFVTSMLMAADMETMAAAHNIDLAALEVPSTMALFVLSDLLYGLLAVFTYAAIRPRCGAGPATAAWAGLMVFLAAMLAMFGFTVMGLFTVGAFVKAAVVWLVVMVVATIAGAAIYKEE